MKLRRFTILLSMCASMVAVVATGCTVSEGTGTSGGPYTGYYSSISTNATGTTLLNQLHTLNEQKYRGRTYNYGSIRTTARYTDTCADTPGQMIGFYTRTPIGPEWDNAATWNREHVWPESLGGDLVENDLHMARPSAIESNSGRGNKVYAASGGYDPAEEGFPNYRGICARIIFYCAIANLSLKIKNTKSSVTGSNTMGNLADLLRWNREYPPSTSETAALELKVEQNRNNVIAKTYQGNRNPFIDHPEFADKIWG